MRIALVSQEYPPETAKGGLGTQTLMKARGLTALGHEIHVISRSPTGERTDATAGGIHVIRIPGLEKRLPVYTEIADWLGYSAEVAVELAALHQRSPLDLVDFPEWAAEGFVHLLNQSEWNRISSVIQLHGPLVMLAATLGWPEMNSEFYRTGIVLEGTCLRLADAVYSSSQCSADWVVKHYGLDSAAIPVLHTGVDTEEFAPRPVPNADRLTIVFAGKIARSKGVHLLVGAAVNLAKDFPRLRLQLLGRGEPNFLTEMKRRAEAAECPDLLDTPGFVDRSQLPDLFSRAHIFAAPSPYEGGPGFVYLEAMACGLPVIACSGNGASEVIRDGENGLLVPVDDEDGLTAALRALLQDAERRALMGRNARQFVLNEGDSHKCIKKLAAFYESVVKRAVAGADKTSILEG